MRGLASESFDLIYLDPPFNSKKQWSAPIGSKAAGAAFKDAWTLNDIDVIEVEYMEKEHPKLAKLITTVGEINGDADQSYLTMMAPRLVEMQRLLKPTGSIYLHCDPVMSHSLKLMLDAIFGGKNFRNEIVWCYTGPGSPKMRQFNRKHDVIFWYNKGGVWCFDRDGVRVPHKDGGPHAGGFRGTRVKSTDKKYSEGGKVPEDWWEMAIAPRSRTEYVGYPTQKPVKLLDRIVKASCPVGGWVLDPFCGCATTCVAAERLSRNWVGIDLSARAADLVIARFKNELKLWATKNGLTHRTDIPTRTEDIVRTPVKELKARLYGAQRGDCNGCRKHFEIQNLEIDHKIPRNRGGHDGDDNKQLLCGYCNRVKGDKSDAYLKSKQPQVDTHR